MGRLILAGGAHVYVCGAAAMAREVKGAVAAAVARSGCDGHAAVARLQEEGRYLQDIWG